MAAVVVCGVQALVRLCGAEVAVLLMRECSCRCRRARSGLRRRARERPMSAHSSLLKTDFDFRHCNYHWFYSSSQYSRVSIISPVSAALSHQLSANWSTSTPSDIVVLTVSSGTSTISPVSIPVSKCGDQAFRHLTALLEVLHPLGGIVPNVHVDRPLPSTAAGGVSLCRENVDLEGRAHYGFVGVRFGHRNTGCCLL